MRHILLFLSSLLIFAVAQDSFAADRRLDSQRLKIMTFNAEFLWDGIEPEEGFVHFSWKSSPDEAAEHMGHVANIISQHNPDIVNLVEVENEEALVLFNETYLQGRRYHHYFIEGGDSYTGQGVVLLSRIDPDNFERDDGKVPLSNGKKKGVTKNYVAKFTINGEKVAIIDLHFLARPLSEKRREGREAQAAVIANQVEQLTRQGYKVIVLGDFNDYDGFYEATDILHHEPISRVLKIIKSAGTDTAEDDLINVARFVDQQYRYTCWWDKNDNEVVNAPQEFSAIDHILIPADWSNRVETVQYSTSHDPSKISDHFPITVTLKLDETGVGDNNNPNLAEKSLRINRLIPNPFGNETENESITLVNIGSTPVNFGGWSLQDRSGNIWDLSDRGVVGVQAVNIMRNGAPLSLNNRGDRIDLIAPDQTIVHTVTYGKTEPGEIIEIADEWRAGLTPSGFRPARMPSILESLTAPPPIGVDEEDEKVSIRIVAANLTSGRKQSYDLGHGIRIVQGLSPDLVLIQEFNYGSNSDEDIGEFVNETFGEDFHYFRETGAQIPNGVVSRWPIIQAGVWEDHECPNREFVWAQIDIPGDKDLWAISLHLLTRNSKTRSREAVELVQYINMHIPEEDYLVIGGDLNTKNSFEAALRILETVIERQPGPSDQQGRRGTNKLRTKPYDWVKPDDDLLSYEIPV